MNDRFRFRVWVTVGDKWCGDTNVPYMDYEDIIIKNGGTMLYEWWDGAEEHEGEYVVMQCTGLKDKNGVLIYEGDVLIVKYDEEYSEGGTEVVFYDEYGFYPFIKQVPSAIDSYSEWEYSSVEVIGNRYENPELLDE